MLFVQKLPAIEPQIRDALKCHIMRKRQRLKQELEQDAIEKRLKREKELKRSQNEMTLDQVKDSLDMLEKKLESLKEEKHHLFVKLKQLLNEDSSKRKQNESLEPRSREKSSLDAQRDTPINETVPCTVAKSTPDHRELLNRDISNQIQKQRISPQVAIINTNSKKNLSEPHVPPHMLYPGNTNPYVLALPMLLPMYPSQATQSAINNSQPINKGGQSIHNSNSMSYDTPSYYRPPTSFEPNGFVPQNLTQRVTTRWPESPLGPALSSKGKHQDQQSYQHGGSKRSHGLAELNDHSFDDRNISRKKPTNIYPKENQFISKLGLPIGYGPSLSAYENSNLRQVAMSIPPQLHNQPAMGSPMPAATMLGMMPNQPISGIRNIPYHLGQNYEYLINQHGKSGLLIAGLNPYLHTQQAGVGSPNLVAHSKNHSPLPNPLGQYLGVENNSARLGCPPVNNLYENSPSRHNISQSLHNSRYVSQNMSTVGRKITLPKNHHNSNK